MQFYDPDTAPNVFDVVWCKWPRREDKLGPGPWVRCVLVLHVARMLDQQSGLEYSDIIAAYGTGLENCEIGDTRDHLVIPAEEAAALGLHKGTVFKLDVGNRKRLPWAEEYFVPQAYVRSSNLIAGALNAAQQARMISCFERLGLRFPLPVA